VLDQILDALAGLPRVPTYAVLMLLSALENVFPPIPADTAVALGAFLARRGEISVVPLATLCWLSNLGSAAFTYGLARSHGATFFRAGWGRRLLSPGVMAALEEAYARWGVAGIFVSRFLPGVRAAVTPFAGVAGLGPAKTLLPAAVASAIWYAFLAFAGYAVAENWEAVKALIGSTHRALAIAAALLTVVTLVWILRRARRTPE
jgi:membrane protein DedA with SNARE-associated domain